MPHFYLHNGHGFIPDEQGNDFASADDARAAAITGTRDIVASACAAMAS